jgi:hypothetical protein
MGRYLAIALAAVAILATSAAAHEPRRELKAHEHGRASLKVAIEGDRLLLDLESPGANIVGFEHEARTDDERAAVAAALARLKEPLDLFVLPATAGCRVADAVVEMVTEDEAEEEHADAHGHDHDHASETRHNEYRAVYELACADTGALRSIGFAFFDVFPATEQIDVTVTGPDGQSAYRVERNAPRLEIAGQS